MSVLPIPHFIKDRFSFEFKYAVKRRLEDVHSLSFALSPSRRQQAYKEYETCGSVPDYLAFAHRWLGVGSVQIPGEIKGAIDYMNSEAPLRVCEIGTEHGGTNLLLSQALPSVQMMVGIDLYIKHKPQLRLLHRPSQQIVLIDASSYTPRTVKHVERILDGQKLDVLFIDGDHRYEGVKQDFLMYRHLVREEGFILFHDIVQDHHTRFGTQTQGYSGGVPLLWQRLKQLYPHREFVEDPNQDGLGIGVLRYSGAVSIPQELVAG